MEKYRHYKGHIYQYLYTATHTETAEKLVIYQSEEGKVYARPYDMFFENVELEDGIIKPRFEKISSK
jgi:hypothetical protein